MCEMYPVKEKFPKGIHNEELDIKRESTLFLSKDWVLSLEMKTTHLSLIWINKDTQRMIKVVFVKTKAFAGKLMTGILNDFPSESLIWKKETTV